MTLKIPFRVQDFCTGIADLCFTIVGTAIALLLSILAEIFNTLKQDRLMKKYMLLGIYSWLSVVGFAQQPVVEWAKTYGGSDVEYPADVLLTADNKYIIAGSTNSKDFDVTQNRGGEDVWVVKLDEDGKILWQRTYGGTGNEGATSIKQTKDGGYMLLGVTNSIDGDFIAIKGGLDIFLSKLDSLGNIQWTKIYGGNKYDFGSSFFETKTGEFIMSTTSKSDSLDFSINYGDYDMWILKLSSKGDIIWKKHFGGSMYDFSSEVIQVENNNYLFVGSSASNDKDMVDNEGDVWIKLDSAGNIIWKKSFGNLLPPFMSAHSIRAVKADSLGYIGIGSAFIFGVPSGHHNLDILVLRINKNGDVMWKKGLGGQESEYGSDVEILSDGSFIISGTTESNNADVSGMNGRQDYWLVKLDSIGNIKWQICIGGSDYDISESSGLIITKDNKIVMIGETSSTNKTFTKINGIYDWGVVKLKNIGIISPVFEKNELPIIQIYPNPVSDFLYVRNNENAIFDFKIIDLQGKIVKKGIIDRENKTINLQAVTKGLYILTFQKDNVLIATSKVIVH